MDNPTPYLSEIEELDKLTIVRLQGNIDKDMVPIIEQRIQDNRKAGSKIDKNVLVDYAKVDQVDSAGVAFHLVRLKEYQAKGFRVGFLNPSDQLETYLAMFHLCESFKLFRNEEEAIKDLNS